MTNVVDKLNDLLDEKEMELEQSFFSDGIKITSEEEKEIIQKGYRYIIQDDSLELTIYIYNNRLHVFEVKELNGRNRTTNTAQASR